MYIIIYIYEDISPISPTSITPPPKKTKKDDLPSFRTPTVVGFCNKESTLEPGQFHKLTGRFDASKKFKGASNLSVDEFGLGTFWQGYKPLYGKW